MTPLVLILGPSGVGKSTCIASLCRSEAFVYVSPYTTRPLRDGEGDKHFVTPDRFRNMQAGGEFVIVNELYGFLYGTPKEVIHKIVELGCHPVLDWPVQMVRDMRIAMAGMSVRAYYLYPPNRQVLAQRLGARAGEGCGRLERGLRELDAVDAGVYAADIDHLIVARTDQADEVAASIAALAVAELECERSTH